MLKELTQRLKSSPSFWQTLANYTERGWGLVYSLVLARIILPEVFSVFVLGISIAVLASVLTRWEVGNLVRSDVYYQNEGFDVVWALSKWLAIAEMGVILVTSAVCASLGMAQGVWITIIVYGSVNALDKLPLLLKCDLEGRSDFKNNLIVKLLLPPLAALITIPMAVMGFGLGALLASAWVAVGLNWIVFRRANRRVLSSKTPTVELLKKVIRPSLWQWVNYTCFTVFNRADKVLVGSVDSGGATSAEAGDSNGVAYYNRAYNFAPLSHIGLGAIAEVPAIVAFRNLEDHRAKWKVFIQRASLLIGAGVLNGFIWLLWADELVVFLFGENWEPAVPYFKVFAFFGAVRGIHSLSGAIMQGSRQYKAQGLISLASIILAAMSLVYITVSGVNMAILVQVTMVISALGMITYLLINDRRTRVQRVRG